MYSQNRSERSEPRTAVMFHDVTVALLPANNIEFPMAVHDVMSAMLLTNKVDGGRGVSRSGIVETGV